jgi:hypothetical protein
MPIVENFPRIDPSVRHIGVSKLRGLNAEKLRENDETFVIQDNDKPLAVLLTYDTFLAMQEQLDTVRNTVTLLTDVADVAALRKGLDDLKSGRFEALEEIKKELKKDRG